MSSSEGCPLAVDGFLLRELFFFLRDGADLFAKLQVLQQNAAYFPAFAQTAAEPAISKYSGKCCGPAFTVDSFIYLLW